MDSSLKLWQGKNLNLAREMLCAHFYITPRYMRALPLAHTHTHRQYSYFCFWHRVSDMCLTAKHSRPVGNCIRVWVAGSVGTSGRQEWHLARIDSHHWHWATVAAARHWRSQSIHAQAPIAVVGRRHRATVSSRFSASTQSARYFFVKLNYFLSHES